MQKFSFSNYLSHPAYFLFWFFIGLFSLSVVIQHDLNQRSQENFEMSSLNQEPEIDLSNTQFNELAAMSDEQLLELLKHNSVSDLKVDNPYALSLKQVEQIESELEIKSEVQHKGFSFQQIAEDSLKTEYENSKDSRVCPAHRLFYEKQIVSNPKLKKLYENRPTESNELPKKCITHIMNSFSIGSGNLAVCSKSSGLARTPGSKPCVTENLVNLTYNAFTDVTECLNLNPKTFLPKIAKESGFTLNAYGSGKDGGIGQFTSPAIQEVNKDYDYYISEIEKAAATKPSCARIIKYKSLLTKASPLAEQRCSMIGLPENPLRNIVYIGIFNRSHMDYFSGMKFKAGFDYIEKESELIPVQNNSNDEFEGVFKTKNYKQKLQDLGIKNPNMHFFKELLTIAGYNMGTPTALRLFSLYLDKRKLAKKNLTLQDFDFNTVRITKDIYADGKEKNIIDIARSFIMSSFISPKDSAAIIKIKLKKRKQLPKEWASSYLKTFPEFLTLNANNYDGKMITPYVVYGFPGYVSGVAKQNQELRNTFNDAGIGPDFCSDPHFLVLQAD